jgi:fatty-acyl-CoA synthase
MCERRQLKAQQVKLDGVIANGGGAETWTQRVGGFRTIAEGLDYAAGSAAGYRFFSSRGQLQSELKYYDLQKLAKSVARKLISLGLRRGDRLGIVAETGPDFMAVFFGCQYVGIIPCPMPYSMYIGGKEAYITRVRGMLNAARANAVVTTSELEDQIRAGAVDTSCTRVITHKTLAATEENGANLQPFGPEDVAYIQYSSGSTSEPKGVLISQRSIMANANGILRDGLRVTPKDRAFSWLPFYHDMGLVGFCLSPMLAQVPVDFISTSAFARRPALWLKLMSDLGTTVSYSPTFGYDLAAKRINGEASTLDLSNLRIAGIGGDMVRPDVLNTFAKTLKVAGFDAGAFLPSYGMAESTLAVSFAQLGEPVRVDTIMREDLKSRNLATPAAAGSDASKARSFVICGRALPGHEIEVRDDDGNCLKDRQIGRIFVKGPSIMSGYYERIVETANTIGTDGYLDTGDMGYVLGGELVITGRAKDLILHNGRNIWPQDLEWTAEKVAPLKSGDVAAFAVENDEGNDEVVVLVECRLSDAHEQEVLRREVGKTVHQSAGVDCKVVLVAPRSLQFTSSGKLSRAGTRERYLNGEIVEVNSHIDLGAPVFLQAAQ